MTAPFILLVDDEVDFVATSAKRLEIRNFRTISAYSGEECLEKLKDNPNLDVIILDVKMPGIDGIKTLEVIKNKYPLIEVIMLTGHATVESAIEGMKLGAFDYLMKPCEIEELVRKVEEAAQKKWKHEKKIKMAREKRIKDILSIYDS